MSIFEDNEWEELDAGVLGDGPGDAKANFIVTDISKATHRLYRNRRTGETLVSRIAKPRRPA